MEGKGRTERVPTHSSRERLRNARVLPPRKMVGRGLVRVSAVLKEVRAASRSLAAMARQALQVIPAPTSLRLTSTMVGPRARPAATVIQACQATQGPSAPRVPAQARFPRAVTRLPLQAATALTAFLDRAEAEAAQATRPECASERAAVRGAWAVAAARMELAEEAAAHRSRS